MCGGGSDAEGPGSTSGGMGGGFGGVADSVGGGFGLGSVAGNTAAGVGGAGFGGNNGNRGNSGGGTGDAGAPSGLRSIDNAHKGLAIAGPQLSRAKDNAYATALARGLTVLGVVTGFPGFSIASKAVGLARDYGRGYADRTDMEKAADALGMGAATTGGDAPKSGGLSGTAKQQAKAPAKAPASGNVGSGAAGATVIMGADKTRTGAGAGGRARGSAVRGFGSGGLKL